MSSRAPASVRWLAMLVGALSFGVTAIEAQSPAADPSPVTSASADASPAPDPSAEASPAPDASAAASPAPDPSVEASPAPDASAAASPAPDPSAEASPATTGTADADASPAPDPSAEASPATTGTADADTDADSDEASPAPDAAATPAKPVDPFEGLDKHLVPFTPHRHKPTGKAKVRDPFVPPNKILEAPKADVVEKPPSPIERAREFRISGVFFGQNLRAVRIAGKRVNEGEWFDESGGKVTSVGDGGEFKLLAVTPRSITFANKDGDKLVRENKDLRRQSVAAAPRPAAAASPASESSPDAEASPASEAPSDASSPASESSTSPGSTPDPGANP